MPFIPINPDDLPTEQAPLDESLTYKGDIARVGEGTDKNSNDYISLLLEVTEPEEWSGRRIYDNYIPLPHAPTPDMDARSRRIALDSGIRLGQLLRSANFRGSAKGFDTEELVGCSVKFTVSTEEYQGRLVSRVRSYLV